MRFFHWTYAISLKVATCIDSDKNSFKATGAEGSDRIQTVAGDGVAFTLHIAVDPPVL